MVGLKLKNTTDTRIMIAETGRSLRQFSQHIGVSHAYLSQILNKRKTPSPTVAYKIASGLNKNTSDIFLIKTVDETYREIKV